MIRIKNWKAFQHYKNRRPPWIRLYRDLLDDPDFEEMDGELVKTLIKLWLSVSDFSVDGTLPAIERLALRMHIASTLLASRLVQLKQWLECDDSELLAYCKHIARPEGEQIRADQSRSEGETETPAPARDDSFDIFWEKYDIKTHKAETIVLWGKLTKAQKIEVMIWLNKRIAVEEEAARDGWFCANRPNPASFLRKKRWQDEIPRAPRNGVNQKKTQHERNLEILKKSKERRDGEQGDSRPVSGDDIRIVPKI